MLDRIDALLPQTQCGQCSYAGCRPYAEAIVRAEANINQCPPGGETGIRDLAELLGREPIPLNPENGVEKPRTLVNIDEQRCIGCALCIQACPVDAIVGAAKFMHTVIASHCTGCDLCLPPCPVDCIDVIEVTADTLLLQQFQYSDNGTEPSTRAGDHVLTAQVRRRIAGLARRRFEARQVRLSRDKRERAEKMARHKQDLQSRLAHET